MLTRKHFRALAEAVSEITDLRERGTVCKLIADICAASNPQFDRGKFYEACGL